MIRLAGPEFATPELGPFPRMPLLTAFDPAVRLPRPA